jgi:isopentenyl diphosphate isomerase/L-lactate dehydrogenase-like FMN-dependent dehydrogenase
VQIGLEDPVAHQKLGFNPLARNATAEQKQLAALYHVITTSRGVSPVWRNITKLRDMWGDKPIVLKGVQSVEDAISAVHWGLDGIILSNVSYQRELDLIERLLIKFSTAVARLMALSVLSMRFQVSWMQ